MINRLSAVFASRSARRRGADPENLAAHGTKGKNVSSVQTWLRQHVTLPATFGYTHVQSKWGFCTIPTRIQSILVLIYLILNILFCAVDYDVFPMNI